MGAGGGGLGGAVGGFLGNPIAGQANLIGSAVGAGNIGSGFDPYKGYAMGSQLGGQVTGGSVGDTLGVTGGAGPAGTAIYNPVSADQLQQAQFGTQGSLTSQQNLLNALQAQRGMQNQSQVFNQMQGVANGTGPNPAQAMLNQATGNNVAQQAALMAGQRGASQNVGLMARQIGQQGAGIQQNAAGQSATMQANQQLNALNQMGGMANTMASNEIGQTNANTQAQQAQQQALFNAQQGVNTSNVGMQGNINTANAALANTAMQGRQAMTGGLMNAFGPVMGMLGKGGGGAAAAGGAAEAIPEAATFTGGGGGAMGASALLADGGDVDQSAFQAQPQGPQSRFGQFLVKAAQPTQAQPQQAAASMSGTDALSKGTTSMATGAAQAYKNFRDNPQSQEPEFAKGGQVPVILSPGEKLLEPNAVEAVKRGASPMAVGKTVPGKPKVGGAKNSYANDTVETSAPEGSIVVPRSETKSKNADRASADFVHKILAKRKGRK